ncbi:uncharacterized protein N7483_003909 [Penicillium malachiteum]|uniref:uncharacterized protein n=1 Tax=Penicillium malachiteum TaxID=1324776 RepID=UPI0025481CB8|nr:uncharacterized protein N7483_003909 [Penicillium malachiteum]KAJ5729401.1 hypothetical protein N7483_003909 [Penicillium malachiteum]
MTDRLISPASNSTSHDSVSTRHIHVNTRDRTRNRNHRKKQSEVTIVRGMRSSSPAPPGLSSGESSSPSITSVETESTGLGLGLSFDVRASSVFQGDGVELRQRDESALASVVPVMSVSTSFSTTSVPVDRNRSRTGSGSVNGSANGAVLHRSSRASSSSWSANAASAVVSAASMNMTDHGERPMGTDDRLYTCLFHMLDCHESFDDVTHWKTHVLSHFRTHLPPRMARCPLCPEEFVDEGDDESIMLSSLSISDRNDSTGDSVDGNDDQKSPAQVLEDSIPSIVLSSQDEEREDVQLSQPAWIRMLNHVATAHYETGETLAGSRPDFELMRYLYSRRIISDAQFKAMQLAPAPSSPAYHRSQDGVRASIGSSDEPYCAPYSRRREERMRGTTRGLSVV